MNTALIVYGLTASFGSVLQELVYWYEIRHKMAAPKSTALFRSSAYKLTTIAMIVLTGPAVVIWYSGDAVTLRDYMLTGAAFPLIFKKAAATFRLGSRRLGAGYRESFLDSYLFQA
jgi:hypothetical protein